VTSYLFPNAKFSIDRLRSISSIAGKDKLVVDVRYEFHSDIDFAD
jgi:phosphoribosylformimino-5-aminoimidazole carboxamide ribotide isomerase